MDSRAEQSRITSQTPRINKIKLEEWNVCKTFRADLRECYPKIFDGISMGF